ncbi:MAG: helix-turn-helix transcriptional regulator [Clostridiales bacterium]|nr:helix-turn-helix transcriptional regulator [Clostridiales bacterium]
MDIEKQLKELMIEKSGSVNKFAQECDLAVSTVATIFTRGVNKTNINTIIKICKHLNISVDELAEGRITPTKANVAADYFIMDSDSELIATIEQLDESEKNMIKAYIQGLVDRKKNDEYT